MVRQSCFCQRFLIVTLTETDFVTLTNNDQLEKTHKLDFETMDNPKITINMTCEIKSRDFQQDFATSWKLLNIATVDLNDNFPTVDELSKKVDIFRSKWNYEKASCIKVFTSLYLIFTSQQREEVNPQTPIVFYDLDSLEANKKVEFKVNGSNSLFYNVCQPKAQINDDSNRSSTAFHCREFYLNFLEAWTNKLHFTEIYFTSSGTFEANLCFSLQAFDSDLKKKALATSRICIHPGAAIDSPSTTPELDLQQTANETKSISVNDDENATGVHSMPIESSSARFKCEDLCIVLVFGLPCLAAILIAVIVTLLHHGLRRHCAGYEPYLSPSITSSQQVRTVNYTTVNENHSGFPDFYAHRWEVERDEVLVFNVIGEGEFGVVKKASLKAQAVVIKTVKDVNNSSEMSSLKTEFEQLQKVSEDCHENVIKLMGSYSKGDSPWIILEFCVFESLKNYLLASRLIETRSNSGDVDKIVTEDILRFSMQIAQGMAYLSSKKLVHRDLAARNVLLAEGKVCKISDFGLTRKVCPVTDIYSKSSNDKVPLKWMSPESLSIAEEYTTKSDCWSFGILGYELVMLGTSPYPELQVFNHKDWYAQLKDGYRMTRPLNCSDELFSVFESCWNFNPADRPTFLELAEMFKKLLALSSVGPELWTTPEFTDEDLQGYETGYYQAYIEKVRQTRAAAEGKPEKFASLGEIPKSFSESNAIVSRIQRTLLKKTSLSCSNVGTSIENPGYSGSFDSIQSMRMRQIKRRFSELETTQEIDLSATSSSPLIGYCVMRQSSNDTVSVPSSQMSPSADYLPMDLFTTSIRTIASSSTSTSSNAGSERSVIV